MATIADRGNPNLANARSSVACFSGRLFNEIEKSGTDEHHGGRKVAGTLRVPSARLCRGGGWHLRQVDSFTRPPLSNSGYRPRPLSSLIGRRPRLLSIAKGGRSQGRRSRSAEIEELGPGAGEVAEPRREFTKLSPPATARQP